MNVIHEICNSFNRSAASYDAAAKIQQEIGTRLFERLTYLKINPNYILDLGCGTGTFTKALRNRYPKARIVGLDLAREMLLHAENKQTWRKKYGLVNGLMEKMPFPEGLFDLVFANQVIHWSSSLSGIMSEINRVMNVGGCLMFTTLGPDTFQEIKRAWSTVDDYVHANDFPDMHDVGDVLLAQHFLDPVVDMERLAVHYRTLERLLYALKAQGVRNVHRQRKITLTGKKAWEGFTEAFSEYKTAQGKFPLTYEVIYGHAWKGTSRRTEKGTETMIPLERLRLHSGG